VRTSRDEPVGIASVAISGDKVVIRCTSDPGSGARVDYAMTRENQMATPFPGAFAWGLLRDSDPFIGAVTGVAQPNYSVAFQASLP